MNEIAKIREELLLSQAEMAERLGLNQSTISRFERGDLPVDKRTSLAAQALLAAHHAALSDVGHCAFEEPALAAAAPRKQSQAA